MLLPIGALEAACWAGPFPGANQLGSPCRMETTRGAREDPHHHGDSLVSALSTARFLACCWLCKCHAFPTVFADLCLSLPDPKTPSPPRHQYGHSGKQKSSHPGSSYPGDSQKLQGSAKLCPSAGSRAPAPHPKPPPRGLWHSGRVAVSRPSHSAESRQQQTSDPNSPPFLFISELPQRGDLARKGVTLRDHQGHQP